GAPKIARRACPKVVIPGMNAPDQHKTGRHLPRMRARTCPVRLPARSKEPWSPSFPPCPVLLILQNKVLLQGFFGRGPSGSTAINSKNQAKDKINSIMHIAIYLWH